MTAREYQRSIRQWINAAVAHPVPPELSYSAVEGAKAVLTDAQASNPRIWWDVVYGAAVKKYPELAAHK